MLIGKMDYICKCFTWLNTTCRNYLLEGGESRVARKELLTNLSLNGYSHSSLYLS